MKKQIQSIEQEISKKFHPKFLQNGILMDSYRRLGWEKKATNVGYCGQEIDFYLPPNPDDKPKLYKANFCKDRLCPMCGWRRTKKIFGQVSQILDKLDQEYKYVFVTLTVQNCSSEQLPKVINDILNAFSLLCKYKEMQQAFKGYFRALEITRNPDLPASMEWHPHIHAIFAVKPSYFNSRYYIKHEKLLDLWQKACKIGYEPWVRIQKISPKDAKKTQDEEAYKSAICEVAKYTLKQTDYLNGSNDTIDKNVYTLMKSITSKRLVSLGGILKKTAKELKLDDMTEGDLVHTDTRIRADVGGIIAKYKWYIGWGYNLESIEELLPEEHSNDVK